ncbi:hypothetical protein N7493_003501 [Penicillium malachiteum]|uniref:Uncharacterized protein n=1 Tax=Penicillium malachiteum TaxID=1324776 RepID=A0AAD6MXN2_9EURO|nr:hypothetical protein N7493_003501 [Penicillium malachiteum]
MVNPSKIITLLAFTFASGSLASTQQEPIIETPAVNYYSTFVSGVYDYFAGMISKHDETCTKTITHATLLDNIHVGGYSYEATIKSDCDSPIDKNEVLKAVNDCGSHLKTAGAHSGCCGFNQGEMDGQIASQFPFPCSYASSERCAMLEYVNNDV